MKITNITQLNKLGAGTLIYEVIPHVAIMKHLIFLCEHPIFKGHAIFSRGERVSNELYVMSDSVMVSNLHIIYSEQTEACIEYKKSLKRRFDIFDQTYCTD